MIDNTLEFIFHKLKICYIKYMTPDNVKLLVWFRPIMEKLDSCLCTFCRNNCRILTLILKIVRKQDKTTYNIDHRCEKSPETTVRNLIEFLESADRHDVIDDLNGLFEKDCQALPNLTVANLDKVRAWNSLVCRKR